MNELLDLMRKVENSGVFSVGGELPSIPSGLKVKGVGLISLPLIEPQAKALIEYSEQAPFGRGEETVVNTKIRNAWQIGAEDIDISNPKWIKMLQKSIQKIGKSLGLGNSKINAELYKLLVYEKGSFFTAHRDTEKIPNMFATLVISLPSEHEGGELLVSHAGETETYSFANSNYFNPQFATFYADCYHEVRPITSGYRFCLIYNLSIANRKIQPQLIQQDHIGKQVGDVIQRWTQQSDQQPVLSYLLEHSYSAKNLSLKNLKNGDFAKASLLLKAAEKNNCEAFLCLITYYQTSYGETPYYGNHYYDDDDLDESDFEEYDIDSEETYAHALQTIAGKKRKIKKLYLDEQEILAEIPLRDGSGRGYSISEATGNEGATKELWYHRGGIIIWPKNNGFALVKKMGLEYAIDFFQRSLKNKELSNNNYRQQVIDLGNYILPKNKGYDQVDLSKEFIKLGDIELLKLFVRTEMSRESYRATYIEPLLLVKIIDNFGWQPFEKIIGDILTNSRYRTDALHWLNKIFFVQKTPSMAQQTTMKIWFKHFWRDVLNSSFTKDQLVDVLKLAMVLKVNNVINEIQTVLATQDRPLFLTDLYAPAVISTLSDLKGRDYDQSTMQQCVMHVCQWLERDFSEAPQKPQDWFRQDRLFCSCIFCKKVNVFLSNAEQQYMVIDKTLKRNIVHLQDQAKSANIDLIIDLIRIPPKFRGNIRKTQKKYETQLTLFDKAQKLATHLKRAVY